MVKKYAVGIFFAIICFTFIWLSYCNYKPIKYRIGRDTTHIINDGKFQICKAGKIKLLWCYINKEECTVVLNNVKTYKVYKGDTYICAEDGYAVVDEQNKCRLFLNYTKEEMEQGYITNSDGYDWDFMSGIERAYSDVKLLYEFNDFTKEEQKILYKMNNNTKDKVLDP